MFNKQAKKIRSIVNILGIVLLLTTTAISPSQVSAHTLSPYKKDYVLYAGDELSDSFNFTNTSDERLDFNISVSAYNPQDGSFVDDEIFITPIEGNVSIAAGEMVQIKYKLDVPAFHDEGSYFNIIVVEENIPQDESTVGFKTGFGMIAGIHIVDENGSIKGAFSDFSDILLSLVEKGLPYISPTVLKYRFQNNSPFVFMPDGEIRVFDTVTNERILKERLNTEDLKVFPSDFYETSFSFDVWNYQNMFHDLKVVTRTYNQFDNNYIENVALIPGFSYVPFLAVGGGLVVLVLVVVTISKKKRTKRKSKTREEKDQEK